MDCVSPTRTVLTRSDDSLPILRISPPLRNLRARIDEMASKEQIVLWRYSHGVAHEGHRIARQSQGHRSRDTVFISC